LVDNNIKITKEIIFSDHHNYTQKDIDYVIYGGLSFYQRKEIKDFVERL
jgi:superfamily I DNA/RNA helicase